MFIGIPWITTPDGGSCTYDASKDLWSATPPASLRVNWSASDKDASLYEFQVFRDDVYWGTVAGSGSSRTEFVSGSYVIGGTVSTFNADWTYSVKIVRLSDANVMEVATAAEWTQLYGQCPISA